MARKDPSAHIAAYFQFKLSALSMNDFTVPRWSFPWFCWNLLPYTTRMVKNVKIFQGLQVWELPDGTDVAELTSVLAPVAILCFSISEERWEKEPQRCKGMIWVSTRWRTKQNEKLLQSPVILLVALTEFFFTWLLSLNWWMICSCRAAFSRQKFQVGWKNEPVWWEGCLQGSWAGYRTVILFLWLLCQLLNQMSSVVCAVRC